MAATTSIILYRGAGTGHVTGQRLLPRMGAFAPSGYQPAVPLSYSPWPQGPEPPLRSSLGSKRRKAVSKALHEAAEREEPEPKKKRARKKTVKIPPPRKKPTRIASETRAIEQPPEPPIDREPEPLPAIEEPYIPRVVRSISGIGLCRGRRRRAIIGAFEASGGGEGKAPRLRRRARTGRLEPEGIQNPSIEQLLYLTAA